MRTIVWILIAGNLLFFGLIGITMAEQRITICGTGDSQDLLHSLAKAYEEINPETSIVVPDSIGSGGGIKATALGKCDMGRVARPIKRKEKKYGLNYKIFSKSPVVFVLHPSVTGISSLTTEQIIGIYEGKYTSWDQLGGPNQKIFPIGREDGDSSRSVLNEKLSGFTDIKKPTAFIVYSSPEIKEIMMKHSFTIGYGTLSMFNKTGAKIISVNGISPSEKNVNNETYELTSNYGIVYKGELNGLTKSFLDFLFTSDAIKIIRDNGAFPTR